MASNPMHPGRFCIVEGSAPKELGVLIRPPGPASREFESHLPFGAVSLISDAITVLVALIFYEHTLS